VAAEPEALGLGRRLRRYRGDLNMEILLERMPRRLRPRVQLLFEQVVHQKDLHLLPIFDAYYDYDCYLKRGFDN